MQQFLSKTWVRHSLIVLGIVCLWQVGAVSLRHMATNNGKEILKPISNNSRIEMQGIAALSNLDKPSLEKLLNLFTRIENQKEKHKTAFLTFYPFHFASSVFLLILSSISVIVIFLISQVGLNNTSPYLRTVFFALAALTAFYAFSPLVFKQEANISNNLSKYILYDNLQGEIYNYAVTNPNVTSSNDTLSFTKFHSLVTKSMAGINSINVEFDYKIIPVPDFGLTKK